jgi:phosphohistidine swiveling domain-containing protein
MTPADRNIFTSLQSKRPNIVPHEVGGKAWNLFRLSDLGFPVPAWCVLSSQVFNEAIGSIRGEINKWIAGCDFGSRLSIDFVAAAIGKMIREGGIPADIRDTFKDSAVVVANGGLVSVRSSVVGEDSSDASFAGQMDSFLNVGLSELFEVVLQVWASAFSARALLYRYHKGLDLNEISAAVIVQRMVGATESGVLFSCDPETETTTCVISAGFGLGEGVVSNSVEADTYRVPWDGETIQKEIPIKDHRVVCRAGGGTQIETLPEHARSIQVLSDKQIIQLRDLACVLERCFGLPQDVEWAYDEQGRLFVLQARPIVMMKKSDTGAIRIWDNSNIVESYPGITLPLTFSFIRKGYENAFRNAALGFFLFKKSLRKEQHIFKNMVGLLEGRVYYNLLNWYRMLSFLPGSNRHKESWDQMIGISRKIDFPQTNLSFINRFTSVAIAVWRLLTGERNARTFFRMFNSAYARYKNVDFSHASEEELIGAFDSLDRDFSNKWHLTLYNDFCAMKYYDWLKQLCSQWGLESYGNLHHHLLCGETGVESVAPVHSLLSIAETVRANEAFRSLFSKSDDQMICDAIQRDPGFVALKSMIDDHLARFGDRGLEELKLEKPTFRDDPVSLIGLIRSYAASELSIQGMEQREWDIRYAAESFARRRLRNPVKRWVFRFVLNNARRAIVNRENMRFARSRLYGLVRRIFRRMAALFVEKGLLDSPFDIYYLTVDEVFGVVEGAALTQDLRSLVQIRKAEYAEFAEHLLKERIETKGVPYLNPLHEDKHGSQDGQTLKGVGCSSGAVEGPAKIVFDPTKVTDCKGYILVARSTDPGWVFLMISAKGIIVEKGSVLSHSAIIGRELGIPTIIAVANATRQISDGARVWMNASTGEVRWE